MHMCLFVTKCAILKQSKAMAYVVNKLFDIRFVVFFVLFL